MLKKTFYATLSVSCTDPAVVAKLGEFADHLEANHPDIENIHVRSETNGYRLTPGCEALGSTIGAPFPPAADPATAPVWTDAKPKSRKPRAPKNGDYAEKVFYPEEVTEVAIAVSDIHPDSVAEMNAAAVAQGELPLPEVEGAEVEVTLADPAEVIEPAPASTRELTRDDVFEALRALLTDYGNAAAKAALSTVGQVKFSDVPSDKLGDLFDAIQAYRKDRE
ncbi:MAG: hypothetical protein ACK5PF_09685 [bacterium]